MADTGILVRHGRACRTRDGGRCNCTPNYQAWVYSKRDQKKIKKSFPTRAAAKAWRTDALNALNRGRLRATVPITLKQAADEFMAGARDGTIPHRAGHSFKPATLRGYERGLARILAELGHKRLGDIARADVQDLA